MSIDEATAKAITESVRDAVGGALREARDGDAGKVGRTPSDAATEISRELFRLLGQWTLPILLLVLLSVGWYFLQEQNARLDDQYKADLEQLRAERNRAYEQVALFSDKISTVSGQQIDNLGEAFDKFKTINEDTAAQQKAAFEAQSQADGAKKALEVVQAELAAARGEIERGQTELQEKQKELEAANKRLEERVSEVERKERDLSIRGGKIGELQDLLRNLEGASEQYTEALLDRGESVRIDDPDTQMRLDEAVYDARIGYEQVVQSVLDIVANPADALAPIAAFDSWELPERSLDDLVGVSLSRFSELVEANQGFGFDFWQIYEGSEPAIIGLVRDDGARMRFVALILARSDDGDMRIVDAEAGGAFLPLIGPSSENAWGNSIYLVYFDRDAEVDELPWEGTSDVAEMPLSGLLAENEEIRPAQFLFGEDDMIPVISVEDYQRAVGTSDFPIDWRSDLRSPRGMEPVVHTIRELEAGATSWRRALAGLPADLRRAVEPHMQGAIEGALNQGTGFVPVGSVMTERDLGRLAAILLLPGLDFSILEGPLPEPVVKGLDAPPSEGLGLSEEDAASAPEVASVLVTALDRVSMDLVFERRSRDGEWNLVSVHR